MTDALSYLTLTGKRQYPCQMSSRIGLMALYFGIVNGGEIGLLKKVGLGLKHREWQFRAGDIRHDTLPHVLSH